MPEVHKAEMEEKRSELVERLSEVRGWGCFRCLFRWPFTIPHSFARSMM